MTLGHFQDALLYLASRTLSRSGKARDPSPDFADRARDSKNMPTPELGRNGGTSSSPRITFPDVGWSSRATSGAAELSPAPSGPSGGELASSTLRSAVEDRPLPTSAGAADREAGIDHDLVAVSPARTSSQRRTAGHGHRTASTTTVRSPVRLGVRLRRSSHRRRRSRPSPGREADSKTVRQSGSRIRGRNFSSCEMSRCSA